MKPTLKVLTTDDKRAKLAESLMKLTMIDRASWFGWNFEGIEMPGDIPSMVKIPDFFNDVDAAIGLSMRMSPGDREYYQSICGHFSTHAEAIGIALNLWTTEGAEQPADNLGSVVTCVYCGHEYPSGTPTAKASLLTEHIKGCPQHPLRETEERLAKFRTALVMVLGATSIGELKMMHEAIDEVAGKTKNRRTAKLVIETLLDDPDRLGLIESIREASKTNG